VNLAKRALSAVRRVGIVIAIAVAFLFGLTATVYLSLRSPEVNVPNVVGKDRFAAEKLLSAAGLNSRVRANRPSNQFPADTVLFQLPRAGELVKAGQTIAMDISRAAKEGEAAESADTDKKVSEVRAAEQGNSNTNTNENRPKRNRNANKNANENGNTNANGAGANTNANSPTSNTNTVNRNTNGNLAPGTLNSNRGAGNSNSNTNRNRNQNENRRPPAPAPNNNR
jgi:beta-lactam-binding protein with PASTA domain